MTETRLIPKEKELIAVGAAISAGCIRCAHYHFKKVFQEGATLAEVKKAVSDATLVIKNTQETMQRTAFTLMEEEREWVVLHEYDSADRMSALVKLGAAVVGNCTTSIEKYLDLAKSLEVPSGEITMAVKLAKAILKKAGEFADKAISEQLNISPEIGVKK